MVLIQFGAGFLTGIAIVHTARPSIYERIAAHFVRPHVRFLDLKRTRYTKDSAHDINLLDLYLKDAILSFFMFWLVIGPAIKYEYFSRRRADGTIIQEEAEDSFATILNNANED